MFGMSLMDRFKSLDVYRKLPSDFVQPTYSGALLSIISSVIMIFLFWSEFNSYLEVKTNSEMFVDVNRGGEKLNINVDIDLIKLPCSILSLDVQDVMGSHSVNVHGSLMKYRLDKNGKVLGEEVYHIKEKKKKDDKGNDHDHDHDDDTMPDYETVKAEITNGEGCRIKGYFLVNKVPGNFHISSHAFAPIIHRLFADGFFNFDLSHRVNHFSFGDDKDLKVIKRSFATGELNPIDKTEKIEESKKFYEYYIKVVPTTYIDISGNIYYVNQFTSNSNEVPSGMNLPAVYFRFDMSPVTVKFWQYKDNILHFIIQICAIIGGIFSVTGIIDALVHKSVVALLRKANMGKLG